MADYPKLLADDDEGQIMRPPDSTEVPVELPTIVLSDILPATGFLVARDKYTKTILSNSTAFFVSPDVVITAAHSVAPLLRRFHVNLQIISNSRTSGGSRTYNVTGLTYDNANAPCHVLLQVRTVSIPSALPIPSTNFYPLSIYLLTLLLPLQINGNHTHTLPLSKHPAEDGSMVRVISNSPIGFGGIHLDGTLHSSVESSFSPILPPSSFISC